MMDHPMSSTEAQVRSSNADVLKKMRARITDATMPLWVGGFLSLVNKSRSAEKMKNEIQERNLQTGNQKDKRQGNLFNSR